MCLHFHVIIGSPRRSVGFIPATLEEELVFLLQFCRQTKRLHLYLFFLQLTFPIPSLQSKRVHVSFINCAKAADNNLEEYSPDAYHLVWTLALATACLISLTHTAQPAPSASWALCLRPQWDFHLDQAPSCLQEHSSYNVLLSAVLLASDCSEGLGSTGPALLIYQFLSCFSTLLFPLQLYCVFCLCSFV